MVAHGLLGGNSLVNDLGADLLECRNPAAVHVGDLSLADLLVLEALRVIGREKLNPQRVTEVARSVPSADSEHGAQVGADTRV